MQLKFEKQNKSMYIYIPMSEASLYSSRYRRKKRTQLKFQKDKVYTAQTFPQGKQMYNSS